MRRLWSSLASGLFDDARAERWTLDKPSEDARNDEQSNSATLWAAWVADLGQDRATPPVKRRIGQHQR